MDFPASNGTLARTVLAQSVAFGPSGAPMRLNVETETDLKETNRCSIV